MTGWSSGSAIKALLVTPEKGDQYDERKWKAQKITSMTKPKTQKENAPDICTSRGSCNVRNASTKVDSSDVQVVTNFPEALMHSVIRKGRWSEGIMIGKVTPAIGPISILVTWWNLYRGVVQFIFHRFLYMTLKLTFLQALRGYTHDSVINKEIGFGSISRTVGV